MIKNKRTAYVFIASLAASTLIMILRSRTLSFAEIVGGAFGLMLVPFLIAYLAKWACQLFSIRFDDRSFRTVFAVGWTLLVLMNIFA